MEKEIKLKLQNYEAEQLIRCLEELLKSKYMSPAQDIIIAKAMEQISTQI